MGGRGGKASQSPKSESRKDGFTEESLRNHFEKHREDFPGISEREYARRATEFRDAARTFEIEQFVAKNGITYRYNASSKEFIMFKEDGTIVTYYKPKNPDRYWMTQREKHEE
jgi:pyocin large subunit-like protein